MVRLRRRPAAALAVLLGLSLLAPVVTAPPASAASRRPLLAYGRARNLGFPNPDQRTVVDMAPSVKRRGYWIATEDGGIVPKGNAKFLGSPRKHGVKAPTAAIARGPRGKGYWTVSTRGRVLAFGSARHYGDARRLNLAEAIVDIVPGPRGKGYWLLGGDGGVFAYGSARFKGSATPFLDRTNAAVAMERTRSGRGYWILSSKGGVYAFGDAPFHGSAVDFARNIGVTDMTRATHGNGYLIVSATGAVYAFRARYQGSPSVLSNETAVAIVSLPSNVRGSGYWVLRPSLPAFTDAPPLPPNSGVGRRIVYCNSCQRVWLVESPNRVVYSHLVSGRAGVPNPGNYSVFSKSEVSTSANGSLILRYMTRFAHGQTLAIGFHAIPTDRSGNAIQSESELGEYRSAGCVRQRLEDAKRVWDFAPVGTPVVVTP